MLAFILFLLTGFATAVQVLVLVAFFVGGRRVSLLEVVSLLGSATLIVMGILTLFRPHRAAVGALIASAVMFSYYGYAIHAAIKNMVLLGSEYSVRLFVPPALLVGTFIYSVLAIKKSGRLGALITSKPVQRRWVAVPLGIALVVLSPFISQPADFFVPRKIVTVSMSWKRGDNYYGPNYIQLEVPCVNNPDKHCYCGTDFKIINSAKFADYIQSFDTHRVPLRYEVLYGRDGQAVSANFVRVGNWSRDEFHQNEGGIGSVTEDVRVGESVSSHTPQDCFAPLSARP